jgi:hypothetical protein
MTRFSLIFFSIIPGRANVRAKGHYKQTVESCFKFSASRRDHNRIRYFFNRSLSDQKTFYSAGSAYDQFRMKANQLQIFLEKA